MERSYKFRLYPNREQEILIQKTFGCVRFVYNHFLDERIQQYNQTGKAPTRFHQDKSLTTLKAEWYGKTVVVIDKFFPSSQLCFVCGEKKNILNEGMRVLGEQVA